MDKADAKEAMTIVQRVLDNLSKTIVMAGRIGADARSVLGSTRLNAYDMLRSDQIGPPLDQCFELCRLAGATFWEIEQVRVLTGLEKPVTLGATLIVNTCVEFCLATEGRIISDMTFVSRTDVENVQSTIQTPFNDAEELAADDMDQEAYMALVKLHAAITNHLVTTARPLPRVLNYAFASPQPSLTLAYRLYSDASRADEVRDENKIVHPAFCPYQGQALSA